MTLHYDTILSQRIVTHGIKQFGSGTTPARKKQTISFVKDQQNHLLTFKIRKRGLSSLPVHQPGVSATLLGICIRDISKYISIY